MAKDDDMNQMSLRYLARAVAEASVANERLDATARASLLASLRERFGAKFPGWPWDREDTPTSATRVEGGYLRMGSYVGRRACLLFSEEADDVWRLPDGEALRQVLEELVGGDEIYTCPEGLAGLLCFNHHDYLVGWGDARAWIEAQPEFVPGS